MANQIIKTDANKKQEPDFMEVLMALERKTLRDANVASLGTITALSGNSASCAVFPLMESESEQQVDCRYLESLVGNIAVGDIVVILFLDRDFRERLDAKLNGKPRSYVVSRNSEMHTKKYGIIIGKMKTADYNKEEETTK